MTTIEEKQNELDALQAEFDEYIESSREMEVEMEAELTKCQNDLAKAESRNAALSTQLASIQPQLGSLQTKLSEVTAQLSSETQRRVSAEMKTEETENRLREAEGTLAMVRSKEVRKLKEENEDLFERIALVEGEAEECRNELSCERERHREEVEALRGDVDMLRERLTEREGVLDLLHGDSDDGNIGNIVLEEDDGGNILGREDGTASREQNGTTGDNRVGYIKSLEDELKLFTEQLIETKTKLSQTQAMLEDSLKEAGNGEGKILEDAAAAEAKNELLEKVANLEMSIKLLQDENAALKKDSKCASPPCCVIC